MEISAIRWSATIQAELYRTTNVTIASATLPNRYVLLSRLAYFRALQFGPASRVAPIAK